MLMSVLEKDVAATATANLAIFGAESEKRKQGLTRLLEQEAEDAFEERKVWRESWGGSRDKDVVSDDSDARCGDVNTGISSYAFHGIIIYNKRICR